MPGIKPYYDVKNPAELSINAGQNASATLSSASRTFGAMSQKGLQQKDTGSPPKTATGGLMSSLAAGVAGSQIGAAAGGYLGGQAAATAGTSVAAGAKAGASTGGWYGAAIGAAVGLLAYYIS